VLLHLISGFLIRFIVIMISQLLSWF